MTTEAKPSIGRQFWKIFLTGLFTVLPVFLTFYLISWFAVFVEQTLSGLFVIITPDPLYFRGLGLIATAVLIFLVGLGMRSLRMQRVYRRVEWGLESIPLLKSIYASIRDFVGFVAHSRDRQSSQVVLVSLDSVGTKALGLVTRADLQGMPEPIGATGLVAVYIPMSYQLGGYTLLIPQARLQPVHLKVEEALGLALTGWVKKSAQKFER